MNKIKIENNDMTLTVRMSDEEAEVWFGTLSRALLGDYPDIAEVIAPDAPPRPAEENPCAQADKPPDTVEPPENIFSQWGIKTGNNEAEGYKGFLLIKCEACGSVHGFCSKAPIKSSICKSCGHETSLNGLHTAAFSCECGEVWRYKTNLMDRLIEHLCLSCGAPMSAEQDKNGNYAPIR